jgi:hypothetical protein
MWRGRTHVDRVLLKDHHCHGSFNLPNPTVVQRYAVILLLSDAWAAFNGQVLTESSWPVIEIYNDLFCLR